MRKKDPHLKPINDLFSKYKATLKAPQGVVVGAFIEVVEDLFQVTLKKESVRYSVASRIITLSASSPLKSEIMMKKTEILTHLRGRLGAQGAPRDIF